MSALLLLDSVPLHKCLHWKLLSIGLWLIRSQKRRQLPGKRHAAWLVRPPILFFARITLMPACVRILFISLQLRQLRLPSKVPKKANTRPDLAFASLLLAIRTRRTTDSSTAFAFGTPPVLLSTFVEPSNMTGITV
jgi:hypothetical protein